MRLQQQLRKRAWLLAFLGMTLPAAFSVSKADTVVVPNYLATNDYNFGSGFLLASNYRSQAAYGASHFPTNIGLVITELRFRPDRTYGMAFTTTVENIQFNLSTTTRNPESLSATFANNVGADDTVVFIGQLTISSRFIGPAAGPKEFDIVVPLTTPFLYNPAAGHLLVDIRNTSGSASSALSGGSFLDDAASRAGGALNSGSGTADPSVEALQVVYTVTNQPPPPPPPPARISRGPYLQSGTTSNIIVRWRTSQPTNSVVRFGPAADSLTWSITNEPRVTNHSVMLTNLSPDTKYFYAVAATETNFASGSNFFFVTGPATQRPIRIWAIGDAGTANQPNSGFYVRDPLGMRDAYYAYSSNRYTDLFMLLGDNAYGLFLGDDGSDDSYGTNIFGAFSAMLRQSVVWSTIGNHDAVNTAVYQDIFSFPQAGEVGGVPSGTELYYSFDYGNIHFVCLDSELSVDSALPTMLAWLEADLQNNTNDWLIAYWHSPPYTWGSHDSDNSFDSGGHLIKMRENVVPLLENYGVDLVLSGHSHVYERSFLLDGHYGYANTLIPVMVKDAGSGREDDTGAYLKSALGPVENEGAVYVVCGSSGWVYGNAVGARYLKHPAMFVGRDKIGSLVLDVSTNRLDAKFLRNDGVVDDYFTLIKGAEPVPLQIKTTKLAGGSVAIQFKTVIGQRYQVLHATRLAPADWTPVGPVITATGATMKWTGTAETTGNHFYQVTLVP